MQHDYDFRNFLDLERLHIEEESFVSMKLDIKIENLFVQILNNDKSFLTEMYFDHTIICFVDRGQKDIAIVCDKFYILEDPMQKMRNIILAPIKSNNIVKSSDLLSKQNKHKLMNITIQMHPNGDKSIIWNIERVKLFIKPYLFRKLLSFFMEAHPDYDYSVEKPNGYYKRNGEVASKDPNNKMTFIIDVKKSVFLFTSDGRNDKVVVCDGQLTFSFHRENYNECKELLKDQYEKAYNKDKMSNSFVSIDDYQPKCEIQMPVGSLTVNLLNACFKICKINDIKTNKRRLMTPCNIFYSSKAMMELVGTEKFNINNEQNINVDKTFLKFSVKEIVTFNDVLAFVMKDMNKFNAEIADKAKEMSESLIKSDSDKDFEFQRHAKTLYHKGGFNQINLEMLEESKSRCLVTEKQMSEITDNLHNTLAQKIFDKPRKATEYFDALDRTKSLAKLDEESESNISNMMRASSTEIIKEEDHEQSIRPKEE